MLRPIAAGFVCRVCGARTDIAEPLRWACPNATAADRRHALALVQAPAGDGAGVGVGAGSASAADPFIVHRSLLAWDSFAAAHGVTPAARDATVAGIGARLTAQGSTAFHVTPFRRHDELSDHLGFTDAGGIWVKDETGQVAGSHKGRHLMTILLHLLTAEGVGAAPWRGAASRPPLAIASCGNAAIAAATLARAADWPITVFVPSTAEPAVLDLIAGLGGRIQPCPRLASDSPGDPCVHRFREAVASGAIPFGVQGTENAWCLDGGRTIGWEMGVAWPEPGIDRLFVQVGGGALAACAAAGVAMWGSSPKLHAVQTEACAPLARAWHAGGNDRAGAPRRWAELMRPWDAVGVSVADGILDDETYDWLPVVEAMAAGGGSPVVVTEAQVREAYHLGAALTGIDASPTGTAGLAGLLATRQEIGRSERVAVIFSGARRGPRPHPAGR